MHEAHKQVKYINKERTATSHPRDWALGRWPKRITPSLDYQSDRHCAKTCPCTRTRREEFDYQSDRHCAKTYETLSKVRRMFDYQSDRHCAKTADGVLPALGRLITSQIDTAPKLILYSFFKGHGLITSQIDTAPKQYMTLQRITPRLITSQIDTAPKPGALRRDPLVRLITSQIDTAPKQLTTWRPRCAV